MNALQIQNPVAVVDAQTLGVELAQEWLGGLTAKRASRDTYARALADFYRFLNMRGITATTATRLDVADYLQNYLQGKSDATRALRCQTIGAFYAWLHAEKGLYNPALGFKVKTQKLGFKKEFLTQSQSRELIKSADGNSIQNKRDRALFALMLTTGARVGEIQNADVGDLVTLAGQLVLKIKGKGHNEKDAFLKIPDCIAELLTAYLDARGVLPTDTAAPLFASHSNRTAGKRISHRAISFLVKNALRGQGIDSPLFTAHSLRHTAAVTAIESGASLAETQIFLRHTSPAITMRYTHGIEARKNQCAERVANAIFG